MPSDSGKWHPLSVRETGDFKSWETLHEGVPSWLQASLWEWLVKSYLKAASKDTRSLDEFVQNRVRILEQNLRRDLKSEQVSWNGQLQFWGLINADESLYLDIIDAVLSTGSLKPYKALEAILSRGGSAWRVNSEGTGLERRVPESVLTAAEAAMSPADRAAQHLRKAWTDLYGINPDPGDGYKEAVKAIEAAAHHVISPSNPKATLGTMIADMRNKPEKWTILLDHPDKAQQVLYVAEMMNLVWRGQVDRHGSGDPNMPLNVSQPEAEAALHLAVTIVQWFRTGVIRPAE